MSKYTSDTVNLLRGPSKPSGDSRRSSTVLGAANPLRSSIALPGGSSVLRSSVVPQGGSPIPGSRTNKLCTSVVRQGDSLIPESRVDQLRSSVIPEEDPSILGSRANTLRSSVVPRGGSLALVSLVANLSTSGSMVGDSLLRSSMLPTTSSVIGSPMDARCSSAVPYDGSRSRLNSLTSMVQQDAQSGSIRYQLGTEMQSQQCVDVLFLCDVTGSMQYIIDAVYDKLDEVIDKGLKRFPGVLFRTAFIGYRDFEDGDARLVVQDFCDDPAETRRFVRGVEAFGGGDGPEDVFGGLKVVPSLSWRAKARVMLHIADMPPHGEKFHKGRFKDDEYPDGDPNGLTEEELLRTIFEKRISYCFLRLTNKTDLMIKIFNEVAKKYDRRIETKWLKSSVSDFVPIVVGSISSSMKAAGFK